MNRGWNIRGCETTGVIVPTETQDQMGANPTAVSTEQQTSIKRITGAKQCLPGATKVDIVTVIMC